MNGPYATNKLAAHPDAVAALRDGKSALRSVHLMPQNVCNHACSFCSYRLPNNKNSAAFDEGKHIPWGAMSRLLADFDDMGVQGIEVTGGGEPLAYPYTNPLWLEMNRRGFATALVTNGTLLKGRAGLLTERMKWARVSIDASKAKTYAGMRDCPEEHFDRAWSAVRELREAAPRDPEFRLGVGFVLDNPNVGEVYDFVNRASESGADNVRLSSCFSDQHLDHFEDIDAVRRASDASEQAVADFDREGFRVHNLIPTRLWETEHPEQDYDRCHTKDVLCVVEGECKVYTCCTFTGSLSGCYGKFTEHPRAFKGLWEDWEAWRAAMNPRHYCKVSCLYRQRNLDMIEIVDGRAPEHDGSPVLHREFI